MFGDAEADAGRDICLDVACYERKAAAWLERREGELRAKHAELCLVKVSPGGAHVRGALSPFQYQVTKKSAKGAVPAMVLDGPDAGELRWIKLDLAAADNALTKPPELTPEQKAEQLEGRRLMHIREALADAAGLAKIPKTFTALRALAVRSVFEDDGVSGLAKLADVEKDAKGMLGAEWNGLMEHIRSALPETYNEYDAATLKVIAELVGADLKALRKAARAAIESETEI